MGADGAARPAKRRRLTNVADHHQNQAAPTTSPRTQPYLSLVGSQEPLHKPKGSDGGGDGGGGAKPANGVYLLASLDTSNSKDALGRGQQEPSECCYGMVRRK
jgi:hypothetical protein